MTWGTLTMQFGWAAGSILFVELVRDLYHLASHQWAPLQRWHNWHHRAYKRDFTPVNGEIYAKAQLYNDAPEAVVMGVAIALVAQGTGIPGLWLGVIYSAGFLITALLRVQGWLHSTDLTHIPGPLDTLPGQWRVNRTYHWRHHFDDANAYYAGHFTVLDKLFGTALSLKHKTVAVTGASGTLGQALIVALAAQGANPVALTTSPAATFPEGVPVHLWQPGQEADLYPLLEKVNILIINHGVNVYGDRTPAAIAQSLEVNARSALGLMDTFLATTHTPTGPATKEVWVNTSEAEVGPAFSPLYELSKRLLGDLVTLKRLDAPCVIRKVVLGPFKSALNPYGVMSAPWVARAVIALAQRDVRNIIVTINPLTYLLFPLKELGQGLYFRLFSRSPQP